MLAQVSLTPAESKKLIAKAIAQMDVVKRALAQGMVVIHPGSSSYFVAEELTGRKPHTEVWVIGNINPKGACMEMALMPFLRERRLSSVGAGGGHPVSWFIKDGELRTGKTVTEIMEEIGPGDVYIRGANALDAQGNVGVLVGNPRGTGGTIGLVMSAYRKKGFTNIFAVGLEKLIPIPIKEAAKSALSEKYEYSMGIRCGLFPAEGIVVTEVKAIQMLSGAEAIPTAAGGLGGAEGSVTLVIKGEREQVTKAIEYVEQSKGARSPQLRLPECHACAVEFCNFPVGDRPWA